MSNRFANFPIMLLGAATLDGCALPTPQLKEGASLEDRTIAHRAQEFINCLNRRDYGRAYQLAEQRHPSIWKDEAGFASVWKGKPARAVVTAVDRFRKFARVHVHYNGELYGYIFLIKRDEEWKVLVTLYMRTHSWNYFLGAFLYEMDKSSRVTPQLRDETLWVQGEMLAVLDDLLNEWDRLLEGETELSTRFSVLQELLKSNYIPVRLTAYRLLKQLEKDKFADHGIGEEFIYRGSSGEIPAWYKKYFYHYN